MNKASEVQFKLQKKKRKMLKGLNAELHNITILQKKHLQ